MYQIIFKKEEARLYSSLLNIINQFSQGNLKTILKEHLYSFIFSQDSQNVLKIEETFRENGSTNNKKAAQSERISTHFVIIV